jgi:hypothetical protein
MVEKSVHINRVASCARSIKSPTLMYIYIMTGSRLD